MADPNGGASLTGLRRAALCPQPPSLEVRLTSSSPTRAKCWIRHRQRADGNPPVADIRDIERICFVYRQGRRGPRDRAVACAVQARGFSPRSGAPVSQPAPVVRPRPASRSAVFSRSTSASGSRQCLNACANSCGTPRPAPLRSTGGSRFRSASTRCPWSRRGNSRISSKITRSLIWGWLGLGHGLERRGSRRPLCRCFPQVLRPEDMVGALGHHNSPGKKRRSIPWVFVWPTTVASEGEPIFDDWRIGGSCTRG